MPTPDRRLRRALLSDAARLHHMAKEKHKKHKAIYTLFLTLGLKSATETAKENADADATTVGVTLCY